MDGRPRPCLGVSSCLLGHRVRYDGNHRLDSFVLEELGACFDLLPICPEVAIGMGVPRPPIRLVLEAEGIHARGVDDPALDVTAELSAFALRTATSLGHLCGYVFKARSPSCGVGSTPVWMPDGRSRQGSGLFSAALREALPLLPVVEDEDLRNPALRRDFLERVYAYEHRRASMSAQTSPAAPDKPQD